MLQFQNDYDKVRQNKVRQNFIVNSIKRISRLQSMVDIGQITFSSCSWLPIEDPHEISRIIALERNLRTFLKSSAAKHVYTRYCLPLLVNPSNAHPIFEYFDAYLNNERDA